MVTANAVSRQMFLQLGCEVIGRRFCTGDNAGDKFCHWVLTAVIKYQSYGIYRRSTNVSDEFITSIIRTEN
jgi:hypothetical protein